ncbi:effector-associated constant component EACC1 [Dactylosporangium salmoneum]|uniref:Uncharacterized protein n=1 Tax=Dactylosporangium salmoneum TaxID=53361 RepID=A0ABN3HN12_9ACTN
MEQEFGAGLTLSVNGRPTDQDELRNWLRLEDDLRGRTRITSSPSNRPDTMGPGTDVVVQVVASLAGATALWGTVARSISTYLTQRHSDITIDVIAPDGRRYSITANRARDPQALAETFLQLTAGNPPVDGE